MPFGPLEVLILVLVILLVFGAKRVPVVSRELGRGFREFKDAILGIEKRRDEP